MESHKVNTESNLELSSWTCMNSFNETINTMISVKHSGPSQVQHQYIANKQMRH